MYKTKSILLAGSIILVGFATASFIDAPAQQIKPAKKSSTQRPVSAEEFKRGKRVYESYCLTCHQADGTGVPRMNPPLAKTDWVTGDKKRLINVVLKGLNEEIEIDGEYFSNPMPSHAHLNNQEIADVLTFVRNSFGNKSGRISVAEVSAERKRMK